MNYSNRLESEMDRPLRILKKGNFCTCTSFLVHRQHIKSEFLGGHEIMIANNRPQRAWRQCTGRRIAPLPTPPVGHHRRRSRRRRHLKIAPRAALRGCQAGPRSPADPAVPSWRLNAEMWFRLKASTLTSFVGPGQKCTIVLLLSV